MLVKALKTFKFDGEVRDPGGEPFEVDRGRALSYERRGLAQLVYPPHKDPGPGPAAATASNPAAETGPFDSAGGQTGADAQPSSSPAAPAPKRSTSRRRAASRKSSSSTKAGA